MYGIDVPNYSLIQCRRLSPVVGRGRSFADSTGDSGLEREERL